MREEYTIGQVASCSGVTVDTVRIYERQGLIEIPERRLNRPSNPKPPEFPKRID